MKIFKQGVLQNGTLLSSVLDPIDTWTKKRVRRARNKMLGSDKIFVKTETERELR